MKNKLKKRQPKGKKNFNEKNLQPRTINTFVIKSRKRQGRTDKVPVRIQFLVPKNHFIYWKTKRKENRKCELKKKAKT